MTVENAEPSAPANAQPIATPTAGAQAPAAPESAKPASAAVVTPVPPELQPKAPAVPEPKAKAEAKAGEEGKTGAEKKPGENATPEPKPGAPEKYDFKAPEGMTLDQKAIDAFAPLAKELNLPQEAAQKLVDLYAGRVGEIQKMNEDNHKAVVEGWKQETLKELGATAPEQLAYVAKTRDRLFDKDLNALIDSSGLGNHPSFIRSCIKAGKAISEDVLVEGKNIEGAGADGLSAMYPSAAKK